MKFPSSSSILFATLAISSSSSSLAAPTGPGDTSLTTSSSNHLAFHRGPNGGHKSRGIHSPGTNLKRRSDRIVERRPAYPELIGDVTGSASSTLGGIVNSVLSGVDALLKNILVMKNGPNVDSVQDISKVDLNNLQSDLEHLSVALQSIISSAPPSNSSSSSSSMPSSATPIAAAAVDGSAFPSNFTSSASPAPTGVNPPVVAVPFAVPADAPANATTPLANATLPAAPAAPVKPFGVPADAPVPALPVSPPALPVGAPSPPSTPANATASTTPNPPA